jgi:arginase
MVAGKVAVFGVPSAAGARGPGMERAAFALREAGLLDALRATGATVVNLSDLSLFPFRPDPEHPRCRNAEVAACAIRAVADEMTRALREGFTLAIGGDCSMVAGTLAGARQVAGEPVGLIFVDADADLNTPETTPSGNLNGMAVSIALGHGSAEVVGAAGLVPAVVAEHVALLGFRALDPGERARIADLALALPAQAVRKLGMGTTVALALDAVENGDGPVVVHLDVDVLDPSLGVAKDTVTPGEGLSWEETSDLLTGLLASKRVVALEVTEFNPERDEGGVFARKLVELLVRAVGRHLRRA